MTDRPFSLFNGVVQLQGEFVDVLAKHFTFALSDRFGSPRRLQIGLDLFQFCLLVTQVLMLLLQQSLSGILLSRGNVGDLFQLLDCRIQFMLNQLLGGQGVGKLLRCLLVFINLGSQALMVREEISQSRFQRQFLGL